MSWQDKAQGVLALLTSLQGQGSHTEVPEHNSTANLSLVSELPPTPLSAMLFLNSVVVRNVNQVLKSCR